MECFSLCMLREDLESIPQHPVPAGYSMRGFGRGDRKTWLDIHKEAEIYSKVTGRIFDEAFACDLPAMPRRCMFLVCPDGRDIGTVTAWYDRRYAGRPWGRIHYVAIVPAFQGRGLCKVMVTAAMNRLRALRHRRVMLTTQTPRIRAIRTYLNFGFVPDMSLDGARRAWSMVRRTLRHPALDAALK